MSYNYDHVLSALEPTSKASSSSKSPVTSPNSPNVPIHRPSSPVLLHPLPSSLALTREGLAQSELELDRQQKQLRRERELAEALQEQRWEIERAKAKDALGVWKGKGKSKDFPTGGKGETRAFTKPPQAYELYQAIDRKDIDFIMRVRDHAFPLLLQKNAGEFPIIYASRIGESHRDVVVLLVGAMSR